MDSVSCAVDFDRGYVRCLYTMGHDRNLAAWEEEIRENFDEIIRHFGDDPGKCQIRGDAEWLYIRVYTGRDGSGRISWRKKPWDRKIKGSEYHDVTMVRVHRNNTPGKKR